ncbi:MAG: DUF6624 domain-containing protein [Bacteroidota bacterium]
MKNLVLILFCALIVQARLNAQEDNDVEDSTYSDWMEKAKIAMEAQDYTSCISCYQKARALKPEDSESQYGIAQCYALDKKYKRARTHLVKSIQLDWANIETKLDKDELIFKKLKRKKRHWRKVQSALTAEKKNINLALRQELLDIFEADQKYRTEIQKVVGEKGFDVLEVDKLRLKQSEIDQDNLKKVEAIIEQYGYPSHKLVGKGASKSIFYVIQHSETKYQEKYLPLFLEASDKGELKKSELVLMIDRIEVNNKRPQIYGTQIKHEPDEKNYIYPIRDEKNVDKRRAYLGLSPLNEYLKRFDLEYTYEPKTYDKNDFRKFVRAWDLVAIRNAETYEIIYKPEREISIEFTREGRLKYSLDVNTCEIPYRATDKGRLMISPLHSCSRNGKDDPNLKKILSYKDINEFELFDRHLYLMDSKNQLWEFKRKVFPKRSIRSN